jgi:DNA repair exonuclease SbcCD nuclease subunit
MNLDFTKPRQKAKEMALEMGIDLTDQVVIREFQKVQGERLIELRAAKEGKKKEILSEKKEYVREDYNDVFRESNRAVTANEPPREEVKTEVTEEVNEGEEFQSISRRVNQPARSTVTPPERKMDEDEEDENSFNPKTILIGAVILLWLSSLLYLFVFR